MSATQLANASQMGEPVNPWMMETGSFCIWGALLLLTLIWTLKDKRLPLFGLVLIAATSSFWQEFFGDWGAYVAWNPAFARLPFWASERFVFIACGFFIAAFTASFVIAFINKRLHFF